MMACMLPIIGTVGAVVFVAPFSAMSAEPKVVIRVNGDSVTRDEVQRVKIDLLAAKRLEGQAGTGSLHDPDLEQIAVRKLIERQLILQEAARQNLAVSEKEFDEALTELRGRFVDLDSFRAWMQERNLDDASLIETIHDDILSKHVIEGLVGNVRLSEAEIAAYYAAHQDLTVAQEVRLRIIAVDSPEAGKEVMTAMSDGESFGRLARRHSMGLLASNGGDTGWVDLSTLPRPLREVVGHLKKGEAYGLLQKAPDEFLIVGLVDRRMVSDKSLDQARPEIERRLLPAKRHEVFKAWLAERKSESNIEVNLSR